MKRFLGRWIIDLSTDLDRSLPIWVQRFIDRDEELRRYQLQSEQLISQLTQQARHWTQSPRTTPLSRSLPSRPVKRLQSALVVACGLLVAVVFWSWFGSKQPDIVEQIPMDPTPVLVYASAGQKVWERVTNGNQAVVPSLSLPSEIGFNWLALSRIIRNTRQGVESAGRGYGQALSLIDRGVEEVEEEAKRVVASTRLAPPVVVRFLHAVSRKLCTDRQRHGTHHS